MKTINNFNKENLKQFREDLQRTLTEFAKQRGIEKINMGTIRFDGNECRFKVEAQIKRPVGGLAFIKNPFQGSIDVKKGDVFMKARTSYEVIETGLKGKFSISVRTNTGKLYKIKPASLLEMNKIKSAPVVEA
jgi:hypothetical protein